MVEVVNLNEKPWYCKAYQSGVCSRTKDQESMGKLQKYICAFCVTQGKVLSHPEKDCRFSKCVSKTST